MTKLEQITRSRAWKGCTVKQVTRPDGSQVYEIAHPKSGASAIIFKDAGDMGSRKYLAWAWKRECERRGYPTRR